MPTYYPKLAILYARLSLPAQRLMCQLASPSSHRRAIIFWSSPRSGLGKYSISVTNSPGLIDPNYRGELMVLVYNGSYVNYWIEHGQRIAQLIIMPIVRINIVEVPQLSETDRGAKGFGSTGA